MRNRRALTCAADAAEIDAAPLNIASHTDGVDGKTLARLELEDLQAHLGLPGDAAEQVKRPKASPVVLQPTGARSPQPRICHAKPSASTIDANQELCQPVDQQQPQPVQALHFKGRIASHSQNRWNNFERCGRGC